MSGEIRTVLPARLILRARRADNQFVVTLNGVEVYNKGTEFDAPFDDVVDLSPRLERGRNVIDLIGINWGGPSHFTATLRLNEQVLTEIDEYREVKPIIGLAHHSSFVIYVD